LYIWTDAKSKIERSQIGFHIRRFWNQLIDKNLFFPQQNGEPNIISQWTITINRQEDEYFRRTMFTDKHPGCRQNIMLDTDNIEPDRIPFYSLVKKILGWCHPNDFGIRVMALQWLFNLGFGNEVLIVFSLGHGISFYFSGKYENTGFYQLLINSAYVII
jgi:hypothetical protein